MRLSISRAMHTTKNTPACEEDGRSGENGRYVLQTPPEKTPPTLSTYERRSDGGRRELFRDVDSEHGVPQQDADLEHDPGSAVQRQIKAGDVDQHEEDAGDEETHHIQQGATADQHLNSAESRHQSCWHSLELGCAQRKSSTD